MALRFLLLVHRQVFETVPYSSALAAVMMPTLVLSAFYRTFIDLFVMVVSVALASRFRQINKSLRASREKVGHLSTHNLFIVRF